MKLFVITDIQWNNYTSETIDLCLVNKAIIYMFHISRHFYEVLSCLICFNEINSFIHKIFIDT